MCGQSPAQLAPQSTPAVQAQGLHIVKGQARAEAVLIHLRRQRAPLLEMFDASGFMEDDGEYERALQAGVASASTMADVLDALLDGDHEAAQRAIEEFVNEAVSSGAVTV